MGGGETAGHGGWYTLIGHAPEADNLTDGFENVDKLILCGRGEQGGRLGDLGQDVPRPCCTGHFRLPRWMSGHEVRLRAGRAWADRRRLYSCGGFGRSLSERFDRCDRDWDTACVRILDGLRSQTFPRGLTLGRFYSTRSAGDPPHD